MYEKAAFVFWVTLILYVVTLFTVSYVGVYLTYIAIPLILISGLIMRLTKPKADESKTSSNGSNALNDDTNGILNVLDGISNVADDVNKGLTDYNEMMEKTKHLREHIHQIRLLKSRPLSKLKYATSDDEIKMYQAQVDAFDTQIKLLNEEINQIKKQCDIENNKKVNSKEITDADLERYTAALEKRKEQIATMQAMVIEDSVVSPKKPANGYSDSSFSILKYIAMALLLAVFLIALSKFNDDSMVTQGADYSLDPSHGVERFDIENCGHVLWTTARALVVRDSPNPNANKVASLPLNTKICIEGQSSDWLKISQGWVSARYTQDSPVTVQPSSQASTSMNSAAQVEENTGALWSNKNWALYDVEDAILYASHGRKVYGHQFGLIKSKGMCHIDMLYFSLSSNAANLNSYKGQLVNFHLSLDDASFPIDVNMLSAQNYGNFPTVVQFSNFLVGDEFLKLLRQGQNLELRMMSPAEFVNLFDIQSDSFSLDGFVEANLKAQEYCERLN